MTDSTIETINEVKLKHRSGLCLDEWHEYNYYEKQDKVCDQVLKGIDPNF